MTQSLRPLRYWMTGCVAVVSLAVGGPRTAGAEERPGAGRPVWSGDWQPSRFGLTETLRRLEARAGEHGLGVLLCWVAGEGRGAGALTEVRAGRLLPAPMQHAAVLVFEPLAGTGTPVSLGQDMARPELPLSLCLRTRDDGRAEVCLPPSLSSYGEALPPEAAHGVDELPALVADALA